jgi:hypothetical protein
MRLGEAGIPGTPKFRGHCVIDVLVLLLDTGVADKSTPKGERLMTTCASLDVSDKACAVHGVELDGRTVWHWVCATDPEEMAKVLRGQTAIF